MNQDDILLSAKSILQGLDALKNEHEKILDIILQSTEVISTNQIDDRVDLLRKSMNMIDLGISEAQVMIQLSHHLQNLEAEKQKLHIQVRRLCQENAWLRDELGSTQKKLHECEQTNACYSVELEHLKFFKDVKLFDYDYESLTKDRQETNGEDLVNDLFPLDDDDDHEQDISSDNQQIYFKTFGSYADLLTSPTESANESSVSTNGYEIPTRLKTLHNLVIQYASQGRYEIAVPLCRQALEDLERTLGHFHPDVATMLNILALVYRDQSNYTEASTLLNDALTIREKTLGIDHPAVAATLNNLAVLYGKRNKFKDAEPLCKRALAIREKCLSPSHPDVAKQLTNLAFLCQNQEKYDEVESYYKRAIDIYTRTLGPNDPNVDKTKNNLAAVYLKQQNYKEAEQLFKDVFTHAYEQNLLSSKSNSIAENHNGQSNWYKTMQVDTSALTQAIKNFSVLCRRQGRHDVAERLEDCALRVGKDAQAILQAFTIVKQTSNTF